jgi:hypothetical protein
MLPGDLVSFAEQVIAENDLEEAVSQQDGVLRRPALPAAKSWVADNVAGRSFRRLTGYQYRNGNFGVKFLDARITSYVSLFLGRLVAKASEVAPGGGFCGLWDNKNRRQRRVVKPLEQVARSILK